MCGQTVTVDSTPVVTGPSEADIAAIETAMVAKRNLAFRKAGKMRKRVMLAKDVLALLNTKKLIALKGIYASVSEDGACNVCALGGLVEACFLRNKEEIHDNDVNQSQILRKLAAFFDGPTLTRVEVAFERSVAPIGGDERIEAGGSDFLWDNVALWCGDDMSVAYNPDARLRLIMANIINNRGEFRTDIPPTDKDYTVGGVSKS